MKTSYLKVALFCVVGYLSTSGVSFVSYELKRKSLDFTALSQRSVSMTYGENLTNNLQYGVYEASIQVGTPAQTLTLQIGTGSSDVWVLDSSAPQCLSGSCLTPFNPNTSQTIKTVEAGGFDINYYDTTYAKGDYITDTIAVGQYGEARMVLQMGLATNISADLVLRGGILGIGYDNNEASANIYPNFMDVMLNNNLINSKLYSIWLNDIDSSTGSILFGGIDTEKYYGTLYSMAVHPDSDGNYTSFSVGLTSISLSTAVGSTMLNLPVTNSSFSETINLSASATAIYLPDYLTDMIYTTFGAWLDSDGNPYVDCKYSNMSTMDFTFESGSTVKVLYREIISKAFVPDPLPSGIPFTDVCFMGIYGGDSTEYVLGDFFLRSAYAVFDMTNHRIGIAQSNLNSTTSNVVEIPAGAASIPQVTGVAMTTASSTTTTTPTPGPTSPVPPPPPPSPPPKPDHTIPIAVGVTVPVVVLLATIIGFVLYRRRKTSQTPPVTEHYQNQPMQQDPKPAMNNQYVGAGYGEHTRMSGLTELPSPVNSPQPTHNGFENHATQNLNSMPPSWSPHVGKSPTATYNDFHGTSGPMPDMPGR